MSTGKIKKILVINGPNINMLGIREPDIYGKETYASLVRKIEEYCKKTGADVEVFQSNHEGDIVDKIQQSYMQVDGIVINPGAYTHTSIAILDALKAVGIPAVEVHISDVDSREKFRQISYAGLYCFKTIKGHGTDGYIEAVDALLSYNGESRC
jgi:3-dehydroquinate dehydratase-2